MEADNAIIGNPVTAARPRMGAPSAPKIGSIVGKCATRIAIEIRDPNHHAGPWAPERCLEARGVRALHVMVLDGTDLDAIRVAALANNAPVSYGALGAPILGLAAVTGLPMMALSASIGNVVGSPLHCFRVGADLLSERLGRYYRGLAPGDVGSLSTSQAMAVCSFLGSYLPDLSGALVLLVLFIFVKIWRPRRFADWWQAARVVTTSEADALKWVACAST